MKITKTICAMMLVASTLFISCTNTGSTPREKSPEELRLELQQKEQSNPTGYLSAEGTYNENFWGDKFNLDCTIKNNASIAKFKDAVLRVTYYTKTKTELGSKDYTVYEIFSPSSSKSVELKIDNYKDVATISVDIIKATPVN